MAKGAHARGKRIAFGDGRRIIWSQYCAEVFRNNPNIAPPGSEGAADLEWIHHYAGRRVYLDTKANKQMWLYDKKFKIIPGEFFFSQDEISFAESIRPGFILIEPFVKPVYPNKQWPIDRYTAAAKNLLSDYRVCQFLYGRNCNVLTGAITPIVTPSIRMALAALSRAALYIGPEGALAHGAAAVGVRAVVIFGGFTDPEVVGYPGNANLTGGVAHCGRVAKCQHCMQAMQNITVEQVCDEARRILNERKQLVEAR